MRLSTAKGYGIDVCMNCPPLNGQMSSTAASLVTHEAFFVIEYERPTSLNDGLDLFIW